MVNFKEIKKLIKDFYLVTGQRIGAFDNNFNLITEYPEKCCDFCEHIRNCNGYKACMESDIKLLKEASKGKTVRSRCHAGLLEICAPIKDDMGISGYLMFGQLLYNDNLETQYSEIKKIAKKYLNQGDFERLIPSVKLISVNYLDAVESILTACISYIHLNKILKAAKTGLWAQIDYYLDRNLLNHFTLEEMSNELGVSISTICKTIKKNSDKTVHQMLNIKRIKKATALLKGTNLNINEIAFQVGIQDYNYFTKIFKKIEGITPTEYRKKH